VPVLRTKLYATLLLACSGGYLWLFYVLTKFQTGSNALGICLIKHITNIPCPSCGSTRSVLMFLHGEFLQAVYINPLGIIIGSILLIIPVWIFTDILIKKETLLSLYIKTEVFLRKPGIALPLIFLVLINWYWNIVKGL
jgi:hypothetical protein